LLESFDQTPAYNSVSTSGVGQLEFIQKICDVWIAAVIEVITAESSGIRSDASGKILSIAESLLVIRCCRWQVQLLALST
jgi:hypothetical protein